MKTINELKAEWCKAESCDECDTSNYQKQKEAEIKILKDVKELIDESDFLMPWQKEELKARIAGSTGPEGEG